MMNQVLLVGRIKETDGDKIILSCPRAYKNQDGQYDTDFIPVRLSNVILENVNQYCKTGDLVGIKGRIEKDIFDVIVVADKVSFLSSKNSD